MGQFGRWSSSENRRRCRQRKLPPLLASLLPASSPALAAAAAAPTATRFSSAIRLLLRLLLLPFPPMLGCRLCQCSNHLRPRQHRFIFLWMSFKIVASLISFVSLYARIVLTHFTHLLYILSPILQPYYPTAGVAGYPQVYLAERSSDRRFSFVWLFSFLFNLFNHSSFIILEYHLWLTRVDRISFFISF